MRRKRQRQLPYLVDTNRELGLMLRGIKPLAYFMYIVGQEPDCVLRYYRLFERHVASGRLIKQERYEQVPALPHLQSRSIFFALPEEAWRIDAMEQLLEDAGGWSAEKERRFGELLGYEDWQNDFWLATWRPFKVCP